MIQPALTASLEDYLEAIYNLQQEHKVARVKDVAQKLDVTMPSVSGVLNNLSRRKLIKHEKHGYVELTPGGTRIATRIHKRHQDLTDFLSGILGLDAKFAEDDACRIEHAISRPTMERLRELIKFINVCPRAGAHWLEHFIRFCNHGKKQPLGCVACLSQCIKESTVKIKELKHKKVPTFACEIPRQRKVARKRS